MTSVVDEARSPAAAGAPGTDGRSEAEWQAEIERRFAPDPASVIPVLQFVEAAAGWVPEPALRAIAAHLRVPVSRVYGVASFYAQFHLEPRGATVISVCRGTACHVRGSGAILRELEDHLGVKAGGTTPDRSHTLETVACFGSCALAPVVVTNGRVHGRQSAGTARALVDAAHEDALREAPPVRAAAPGSRGALRSGSVEARAPFDGRDIDRIASPTDLDHHARAAKAAWARVHAGGEPVVSVGMATCGLAAGAGEVLGAVRDALDRLGVEAPVVPVGCLGMCFAEPLVTVEAPGMPGIVYQHVTPGQVPDILEAHLVRGEPPAANAMGSMGDRPVPGIPRLADLPVLRSQVRVALRNCGLIDPSSVDDYLARDGYAGLSRALSMSPEAVIAEVKASGLRGRGGAGFPTAAKWEFCRAAPGEPKHLICNADEGDPGAFMDRSLLEGDPHAVLEGMCIAAYAIGASRGHVYVRAEYPLAVEHLRTAVDQMRELGLLGQDILGTGFAFDIELKLGAGAFVCGEETALIASLEGRRGQPRPRPPFPAVKGLFGRPSNINNVETLANVAAILREGAGWFAGFGTESSRGTKTFALTGRVARPGLVEIPMGITLGEVVRDIGGGIAHGKRFKAAQTGGPSGGCLPASLADLPIDYEHLRDAGSIMGSGGLVIMDETTCMVDLARYFVAFTREESCGQCTPCREGTVRMLEILERICAGGGVMEDLAELEELARTIGSTSLCGLGQTAPNPVVTTLRYFREEYVEHITLRHCRAGVCAGMVIAPCQHLCPAGVEAHRYVRLVSQGDFEDAYLVVRERMPLPSVCGAVCFHPCERSCRRGDLDEPIAIRALKDAAVRFGGQAEARIPAGTRPPSGRSVAVIGSGPAGLTAAYYLAKIGGHAVTVFEALPEPGGMLRYGIPRYRLPAHALERDLDIVRATGVRIETDTEIGSLDDLRARGFDAVFVSPGAHASVPLGIEGADLPEVMDCTAFLRTVARGLPVPMGERVAVIGGGNSAADAARTALRLGAREVAILYRRDRDEMPADAHEVDEAIAEGVDLRVLVAPVSIRRSADGLEIACVRMRPGPIDASGRRRPEPVEGSEFTWHVDTVLAAIGQHPWVPDAWGLVTVAGDRVQVAPGSLETSIPGVFAGGDAVSGPSTVVAAIAHGREAAEQIDRYLGGDGAIDEEFVPPDHPERMAPLPVEADARGRVPLPAIDVRERVRSFAEVEQGYTREQAVEEAGRCLRCDLRGRSVPAAG